MKELKFIMGEIMNHQDAKAAKIFLFLLNSSAQIQQKKFTLFVNLP